MLGELNYDEMISVLSSQALGRIACSDGLQPYIMPVTYAYDGKYIYGQSNEGTKLEVLRKNPNICFEVDRMTDMRNWQSVIVYGKFEELNAEEEKNARELLFNRVFTLMTNSAIHPFQHEVTSILDDSNRIKQVMYRISIQKLTGRFEKQ